MPHATDARDVNFKRIGRDLREHGLDALPDRGRAHINREVAVRLQHDARAFLRAGGAALDETGNGDAVMAPVDQLTPERGFLRPTDFLKAAIERGVIIAAVELIAMRIG